MRRPLKSLKAIVLIVSGCLALPAAAMEPLVVGAIGDSISTGFDARRIGDNRELSWATGDAPDIYSHAKRLAELRHTATVSYNEAVAGSVAADLSRQIDRLLPRRPDYITLTVGANDVCSWSSDYQGDLAIFRNTLRTQIRRLTEALPATKIAVSPVPDLYNLWEVSAPQRGCQSRWNMLRLCTALLGSGATPSDRAAFVQRWSAINDAIAEVAEEFPDNVLHNAGLAHARFDWEHVSPLDCFHPSTAGQNFLSDQIWEAIVDRL